MSPQREISSSDEDLGSDDDTLKDVKCKPFKKARFVWQIKGNYHLQNSDKICESNTSQVEATPSTSREEMSCSSSSVNSEPSGGTVPPLVSVNQQSERSSIEMNPDIHPRRAPTSRQSVSFDLASIAWTACDAYDAFDRNKRRAANAEHPDGLDPDDPEWNIRKWQTIQAAKAFMDNTINGVLDALGFVPEPESTSDSGPDDVLGSMNFPHGENNSHEDEEEDESVENEGILSAIQRHGLQRNTLESRPEAINTHGFSVRPSRPSSSRLSRTWDCPLEFEDIYRPTPPSSPGMRRQNLSPTNEEINVTVSSPCSLTDNSTTEVDIGPPGVCKCPPNTSSVDGAECTCLNHPLSVASTDFHGKHGSSDEDSESSFNTSRKPASSTQEVSTEFFNQVNESCKKRQGRGNFSSTIVKRKCPEPTDETSKSSSSDQSTSLPVPDSGLVSVSCSSDSPTFGHFEFMDAAVAAAIQKKGLSALACQDL